MADHREDDPFHSTNQVLLKSRIAEVLQRLNDRECAIIRLRYGFVDGRSHTCRDLGTMFGITRERVRQIELSALGKLRFPTAARQLVGFLEMPL